MMVAFNTLITWKESAQKANTYEPLQAHVRHQGEYQGEHVNQGSHKDHPSKYHLIMKIVSSLVEPQVSLYSQFSKQSRPRQISPEC
jgi:hypothetical protein